MAEYEYNGCVTGVVGGGITTLWQPNSMPVIVDYESNAYSERLDAMGILMLDSEFEIDGATCRPMPSEWSEPITWAMVNHPNSAGYVSVAHDATGSPNFGINLNEVTDVFGFFDKLNEQLKGSRYIQIGVKVISTTNVKIRFEPSSKIAIYDPEVIKDVSAYPKRGVFHKYDENNFHNNGYSTICLSDAFRTPPVMTACLSPSPIFIGPQ